MKAPGTLRTSSRNRLGYLVEAVEHQQAAPSRLASRTPSPNEAASNRLIKSSRIRSRIVIARVCRRALADIASSVSRVWRDANAGCYVSQRDNQRDQRIVEAGGRMPLVRARTLARLPASGRRSLPDPGSPSKATRLEARAAARAGNGLLFSSIMPLLGIGCLIVQSPGRGWRCPARYKCCRG